jgi:uncharacterized protein (DUF3820 family)
MQPNTAQIENETCPRCGSSDLITRERQFKNRTIHIELRCVNGHFIKFVSQNKPVVKMPFGLYRGVAIRELPDAYLTWILENLDLKGGLFGALSEEYERRGAWVA